MLPFNSLDQNVAEKVFLQVRNRLLTPYGLRSMELTSDQQQPHTPVYLHRYMADYYNGAIWPWSVYLFTEAFSKTYQNAQGEARKLFTYFEPLLKLTQEGLVGYIPEVVSIDGEITQCGMVDYYPASSGILWSFYKLILKMRT
jgi:glycogen debranching enzyme